MGDLNHDGHLDLVTANADGNTVGVLLTYAAGPADTASPVGLLTASLYPNPVPSGALVTFERMDLPATASTLLVQLVNVVGQVVGQRTLNAAHGAARGELLTQSLAPGWYLLQVAAYDAQQRLVGQLPSQRLRVH
jgi:hypothetical protein